MDTAQSTLAGSIAPDRLDTQGTRRADGSGSAAAIAQSAVQGTIWTTLARFGRQAVQLVASVLVARTLSPVDYGVVGMSAIWYGLLEMASDAGMPEALIQRK